MLTPSSEYFYELAGLFQLDQFKSYIETKVDSAWYNQFSEALDNKMYVFTLDNKLFKNGMPLIALANLGNKEVENKIIDRLMNYTKSFNTVSPDYDNLGRQEFFYQIVLENILAKLYSKNSIIATLPMLDNFIDRSDFISITDVGSYPMNSLYINYVLWGKLKPVYRNYFISEILSSISRGNDIVSRKAAITRLKSDIINDKIKWSNLYEYRK